MFPLDNEQPFKAKMKPIMFLGANKSQFYPHRILATQFNKMTLHTTDLGFDPRETLFVVHDDWQRLTMAPELSLKTYFVSVIIPYMEEMNPGDPDDYMVEVILVDDKGKIRHGPPKKSISKEVQCPVMFHNYASFSKFPYSLGNNTFMPIMYGQVSTKFLRNKETINVSTDRIHLIISRRERITIGDSQEVEILKKLITFYTNPVQFPPRGSQTDEEPEKKSKNESNKKKKKDKEEKTTTTTSRKRKRKTDNEDEADDEVVE